MINKQKPNQCKDCKRWICKRHLRDGQSEYCEASKEFYNEGECPYYCGDVHQILKEYEDIIDYSKGNYTSLTPVFRKRYNEFKGEVEGGKYKDWFKVYKEDRKRGNGPGKSEGGANQAGIKQRMKDNRMIKPEPVERREYKEALTKWEEENGKLPKHQPNFGVKRSKIDSYTGDEIE